MGTTSRSVAGTASDGTAEDSQPESGRTSRTRSFAWALAGTIALGLVVSLTFLWVATSQNARDAMTAQMADDLTLLAATFRQTTTTADGGQQLAFPPSAANFRAALDCALEGSPERSGPDCLPVEHVNLALVDALSRPLAVLTPRVPIPPIPERTDAVSVDGGDVRLNVTAAHVDGITTSFVLQGPDLEGNPLYLALQRTTPPTTPITTFAVVGGVAVLAILLVLLPLVSRRDDLLEQQEAAVAGLVKSKADALRAANDGQRAQSDFLTAVSHRFRSPLQIIQGTAKLMADPSREIPPEMTRDLATRLQSNAKKLDDLLRDLLDVDRLLRGALEPARGDLDVAEVASRVAGEVSPDGRIRVSGEGVTGNADGGHLERMLEHLMRNAVQFSPEDGVVEVEASREDDAFVVTVADRGPGIAPEHRLRVFDPLYRIEDGRPDPGVGVGLALVQRLAAAHGGRAWAEPREGGGTVMHLRIPDDGRDRGIDLWQLTGNLST